MDAPVGSEIRDRMRIAWDVPIPMDDGLVLRADVFRPVDDRPVPAIVSYGPYGKFLAFQDGYPTAWRRMVSAHPEVAAGSSNRYQNWEVVDPEKWVPDGYAIIRVDSRGAGRSPGFLDHFSPREAEDYRDCIEWAARQPWCTGKVGTNGISYYAILQWMVAALQPPSLAAICVWEGKGDHYRDSSRHGGILNTFPRNWIDMQVLHVQHGYGERGARHPITGELVCGPETLPLDELARNRCDFGAELLSHALDGPYYRDRSARWDRIDVPLLSAGNWGGQGLHLRGNLEGFIHAASSRKWLEVHGLAHWTHFYTDYGVALQKRFFGHFLKGEDTGWDRQPRVALNIRHPGERFVPRAEAEWPLARTRWTRLHLDPAGRTLSERPPETPAALDFAAMGEGVTFLTAPLEAATEITGPAAARLRVSSSTADADLFLVLRVFDPDGTELTFEGAVEPHQPISQGWLRASHRKLDPGRSLPYRPWHAHDEIEKLIPGVPVALDIEILPTCIVVPKGWRIGLTILGRDFEGDKEGVRFSNFKNLMKGSGPFLHDDPIDRPPDTFAGVTTLHIDPGQDAFILLPVIPEAA
jgi:hypothetical protein